MKRDDLFPSKYLKCADLKAKPRVVEIEHAPIETLKNAKGEEQQKVVLYFKSAKKALPLNLTNFDAVAAIAGSDETNEWLGTKIELYPATTMMDVITTAAAAPGCGSRTRRPNPVVTTMAMVRSALTYAGKGLHVFPCLP